jgi:sialidase-1
MTLKFSTDYGKTWAKSFEVYAGESAYSDLVQIDGDHLGILYEEDQKRVVFVKVNPGAVPPD